MQRPRPASAMGLREGASLRAGQRQTVFMTRALVDRIALLSLDNAELSGHLAAEAARYPGLLLVLPFAEAEPPLPRRRFWPQVYGQPVQCAAAAPGLYEHAGRQIGLLTRDARERAIAQFLLDALDPSGWITRPLGEIAHDASCTMAEAEAVLLLLQQAEPAGLFARSLAECLGLQLAEQQALTQKMRILLENLSLLGSGDFISLARLCDVSPEELGAMVRQIRRLDPKPGARFGHGPLPPRRADLVLVRDRNGQWDVSFNPATLPRIGLRDIATYQAPAALAAMRGIERTVAHRNATVLRVAREALHCQRAFLEGASPAPAALTCAMVAAALGVHETTVGRVRSALSIALPQTGVVPLRDFFQPICAHNRDGGAISAARLLHEIALIVSDECPAMPLSDSAIAEELQRSGLNVARRTIAKYRRQLGIPPRASRKRLH